MLAIYAYLDYRHYLKDYYVDQKQSGRPFSYAGFSRAAGLRSDNYLKLIIEGKRNLSLANIHQFADALRLNRDERRYFEALVLHSQAGNTREKNYYLHTLQEFRKKKPSRLLKAETSRVLERHYYPAVLLSLQNCPVTDAMNQVCKLTGISSSEATEMIAFLEAERLVERKDGAYALSGDLFVAHDRKSSSATHKRYLDAQLLLSLEKLRKKYEQGAKFFSFTYSIKATRYDYYADRIKSLIEDLASEAQDEPTERLVQLNVQFFDLKS